MNVRYQNHTLNGEEPHEEEGTETENVVFCCAILQFICTNQSTAKNENSGNRRTSMWAYCNTPPNNGSSLFQLAS